MSAVLTPPRPTSGPSVATPPPARSSLQPHRWTLRDYRALARTGLIDGKRTILLDGVIYAVPQANPPHNTSLGITHEILQRVFAVGHHVRNQMAFDVGTHNDPGPDLAVVPGSFRDYANRQVTSAVLIVEVAESSLFDDTTTKAELYATAGVPEYWVIDLEHRQLLVFRDPEPLPQGLGAAAYRTHLTLVDTDIVSPLAAPAATIRVAELLP